MTEIFKSKITFIDDLCCGTVLVRKIEKFEWMTSRCADQSPLYRRYQRAHLSKI